jgi:hypothetical protein
MEADEYIAILKGLGQKLAAGDLTDLAVLAARTQSGRIWLEVELSRGVAPAHVTC